MQPDSPQGEQPPQPAEPPRKRMLVDGNTLKLAKRLGMTPEEYVTRVVGFFLRAQEEPALYIIKDEDPRGLERQEPPRPSSEFQEVQSVPRRKVG